MKIASVSIILNFIFSCYSFSQTVVTDTVLARRYYETALNREKNNDNDSAIFYAGKSLAIYSGYLKGKTIKNANALHLLGRLFYNISSYDTALAYNNKALAIRKELLGPDHIDLARSYYNIGLVSFFSGNLEKALENHLEALRIRRKNLKENNPDLALSCNNLGNTYYYMGDNDNALDYYTRALKIIVENYGEKSIDAAQSYSDIGIVLFKKGDYSHSLENHLKALDLRKGILGEKTTEVANSYDNVGMAYCFGGEYQKALENHLKSLQLRTELLGERHQDVASSYLNIGNVYSNLGEYDKVLYYSFKAMLIYRELLGEKHIYMAATYNNIGVIYTYLGEYDHALDYHFKALAIRKELLGEKNPELAQSYINIGLVYRWRGELEKALEYTLKVFELYKDVYGEEHPELATACINIGDIYSDKGENNKALEYLLKALQIRKKALGESHPDVARNYLAIGGIYYNLQKYDDALSYYLKSLQIYKELFGEKHPDLAWVYGNIGIIYEDQGDPDKALTYYLKALEMTGENSGTNNPEVARIFVNIGNAYTDKKDYNKALEYFNNALKINREVFGPFHPAVSQTYINMGLAYSKKGEYASALKYYQEGAASCLPGCTDTVEIKKAPAIKESLNWNYLLRSLREKARIFDAMNTTLPDVSAAQGKEIALRHYQACDTLIDLTRRGISSQSDKLALGEQARIIYREAIDLLTLPSAGESMKAIPAEDGTMAFYFSEKNKSSVLLEALAGQEAQHFGGIPDSLLQKELELNSEIAGYTRKIAEAKISDSINVMLFQDRLFKRNRSIDSLIKVFERQYPEYHNLKYSVSNPAVKDIQKLLDRKTAMISYFTGDSAITIFTLTRNSLTVNIVPQIKNLDDSISMFRYGLTNTSPRMMNTYRRLGFKLYRMLFPGVLNEKKIENLIIIPDGELAIIPFESLLTEDLAGKTGSFTSYPYLIKKYNISYSYSASLFYRTIQRRNNNLTELHKLNDWLALAPVFDEAGTNQLKLTSRELNPQLLSLKNDSSILSRSMFNGSYIAPLPASETETETIFRLFDDDRLKASVLLHNEANEHYIKGSDPEHYNIIHFATHGFTNSVKPELSGLLMAQDTTGGEDGILYSGEIYNLKLNADLVVLSACETGLGIIRKGEGIIGLTRALLYAGAGNLIVSLWPVADESTSDLMVDFYKDLLSGKNTKSQCLRNAKLKMIATEKYSHPLFWAPFILIGK